MFHVSTMMLKPDFQGTIFETWRFRVYVLGAWDKWDSRTWRRFKLAWSIVINYSKIWRGRIELAWSIIHTSIPKLSITGQFYIFRDPLKDSCWGIPVEAQEFCSNQEGNHNATCFNIRIKILESHIDYRWKHVTILNYNKKNHFL